MKFFNEKAAGDVLATGQITITDFNDALSLACYISSNLAKTQVYNPDNSSFVPSWKTTNLILTPSLQKLGSSGDVIASAEVSNVKWYEIVDGGTKTLITSAGKYTLTGTKSHILTVKDNVLLSNKHAVDYIVELTYSDPATSFSIGAQASITFSKVSSGGAANVAVATTPQGNMFKNDKITFLDAKCELYRGSSLDTTDLSYQWYKQDGSVATDQGGGIGWRKLTSSNAEGCTGYTAQVMKVHCNAVDSFAVFKCVIKDTDATSPTLNQTFFDSVSFVDILDPIAIQVESSGGTVFKNGQGTTTLKARLFRDGAEIDAAGTSYAYRWYKYTKDGTLSPNFGGSGINFKTGKTLAVTDVDVDVKATFQIELVEK